MASSNKTTITITPGSQEIHISREFDAPRELVFKAFTDEKLYQQWLGPRDLALEIESFQPWSGGSYRYINIEKNGKTHGFHGVFHEVKAPERIIDTWEYEGLPESGHVALETFLFEELPGGRTRISIHSIFQSVADRDGIVRGGMERGVNESHERLDELLERMK